MDPAKFLKVNEFRELIIGIKSYALSELIIVTT